MVKRTYNLLLPSLYVADITVVMFGMMYNQCFLFHVNDMISAVGSEVMEKSELGAFLRIFNE